MGTLPAEPVEVRQRFRPEGVDRVGARTIECTVTQGGVLSNRKGINRQGGGLSAPALTDKDRDDIRIAAEGARMMLPETTYGVIPDTGGIGRLYQMCGHGVVTDMVLTGRPMDAEEALRHGVVSRVVPSDELDATARDMAEKIAAAPAVTIKMARRVVKHLSEPTLRSSMDDELVYQTFVSRSDDMAERRAAKADDRPPTYTGS